MKVLKSRYNSNSSTRKVKALLCLLLATVFCVLIVICLGAARKVDDHDVSNDNIAFAPTPKKGGIIILHYKKPENVKTWTNKIQAFLKKYKQAEDKPHEKQVRCNFDKYPIGMEACQVNISSFAPCTEDHDFGYSKPAPCVFLKFQRKADWMPQYFASGDISKANLSREVAQDIEENYEQQKPQNLKTIWASCDGKTDYDAKLMGKVNYIPWIGFPGYYFPYHGQAWYLPPLVAVQFEKPQLNIPIDISCKVVAGNFNETVNFKLMIEDD